MDQWVLIAAQVMEYLGVAVTVGGALIVTAASLVQWARKGREGVFTQLRQNLGRSILLGLEFLVAGDIIRTVAERPTLESVTVLGVIVVIRTFLSFTLNAELQGEWPWRRRRLRLEQRREAERSVETGQRTEPSEHAPH